MGSSHTCPSSRSRPLRMRLCRKHSSQISWRISAAPAARLRSVTRSYTASSGISKRVPGAKMW
eukprot:8491618-Alexandrium_andersonii.AAC.1